MFKKLLQSATSKLAGGVKSLLGIGEQKAAQATAKLSAYDEARESSSIVKGMVETRMVEEHPKEFLKQGMSVLQGPQSGTFAADIAKSAAAAVKADAKSPEAFKLMVESHKALEGNIARRSAQSKILHAPEEIISLHTQNIRDARALVATGAPIPQKDKAYEAIVQGIDTMSHLPGGTGVARQLSEDMSKDPVLRAGIIDAAKRLHLQDEVAHKAAAAAPASPTSAFRAQSGVSHSGPDGLADARLQNLGVTPSARPPAAAPTHQYDEGIMAHQRALPPTPVATRPAENRVELYALQEQRDALARQPTSLNSDLQRMTGNDRPGVVVNEISMDEMKAMLKAQEAIARAAATPAAAAAKPVVTHGFQPARRGVTPQ